VLREAEHWRRQIIREIASQVSQIQNAALGEHVLRDMNDSINKKIREKGHWDKRIIELGGPDHRGEGVEAAGKAAPGSKHAKGGEYLYFGAARDLPGVREVLEADAAAKAERDKRRKKRLSRREVERRIDLDYFGFRDEEDGRLVESEALAEAKMLAEANAEWTLTRAERRANREKSGVAAAAAAALSSSDDDEDATAAAAFRANASVPTQQAIQAVLLKERKAALFARFGMSAE
jgi:pre-mRNA-splicing factor ISY1